MSTPSWMREATEPTPDELAGLEGLPEPLAALVRDSTEPLPEELQSVLRVPVRPERRRAVPALVGLAVAASMLLGIWFAAPESNAFRMGGSAEWTAQQVGADISVSQNAGIAVWEVDPVAPSGRFQVVAGDVTVTVLGTVFLVDHAPPEVRVEVLEGRVQVDHPWGRTVLSSGEHWVRSEEAARHAPVAAVDAWQAIRREEPVARGGPLLAPDAVPPPAGVDSRESRFAALLDRVESGETSPELARALDAFAEEADGSLSVEARALALSVHARTSEPEATLADLDRWLDLHPRHPRHDRLLEARATVARARLRRCDLALESYRTLASRPGGPRRARAAAWQGLCASSMGLTDEARRALQQALDEGIEGELRTTVERTLGQL